MAYGGDVNANALMVSLLAGEEVVFPVVDLNDPMFTVPGDETAAMYQPVVRITNEQLTERKIGGDGTFDAIMAGYSAHLKEEYDRQRISGAEYTKAFIALAESAMSNAVQFLISRDQAFWQAAAAQSQAITAKVNLAIAKVQYASMQLEAMNNRASYALTKLRLATEELGFATAKYTLEEMLPLQQNQLSLQNAGQTTQNSILVYQLGSILPAQLALTNEQKEVQRAQTRDHRTDSTGPSDVVTGILGEQKLLYAQQRTSYIRDSELKAAKVFMDAWTARDVIADNLADDVPDNIKETSVNNVLTKLKINNGLA